MARQKVGRNDPCPCGSGKKYKRCCFPAAGAIPPDVVQEAVNHIRKAEQERLALRELGIFVNYVKPVIFEGKKAWALGSGVYISANQNQTFHEFIVEVLIGALGSDWFSEQLTRPEDEQHFIVRCFVALENWKREHEEAAEQVRSGVWALDPSGLGLHLLSLAFDVATLTHAASLPPSLVDRLRHRDQYQGARYEVAVAAIFVRLDCDVRFIEDVTVKHPEFVATFKSTGTAVAVEAKSRHRSGVLHQGGEIEEVITGDVGRLLRDALMQDPGNMPFIVFIDVNVPLSPGINPFDKEGFGDLRNLLDQYQDPAPDRPDPFTAICFTNYSFHYDGDAVSSGGEYLSVWPLHVRHEIDPEFRERLLVALANYGRVPDVNETQVG